MPDEGKPIFNKRAMERLRSPDDLDNFIQVANPSLWLVLVACLALMVGLLAWGFFGTVSSSVTCTATMAEGEVFAFISAEDTLEVNVGDEAAANGVPMTVASVSETPISRAEADAMLQSDYLLSTMFGGDWAYPITFKAEEAPVPKEGIPFQVSITSDRVAPISVILG